MALPKKGSRRVVVDGITYRWKVRGRPTYNQGLCWSPLAYAVEHADSPGTTLVVRTDKPHPGNWMGAPTSPVLPSTVAETIRTAREEGWTPETPGPPFLLDQSQGPVSN